MAKSASRFLRWGEIRMFHQYQWPASWQCDKGYGWLWHFLLSMSICLLMQRNRLYGGDTGTVLPFEDFPGSLPTHGPSSVFPVDIVHYKNWPLQSLKWCCFFVFPSSNCESWEGIAYYLPLGQKNTTHATVLFFLYNLWEEGVCGIIISIWYQVPCQWEVAPAAGD